MYKRAERWTEEESQAFWRVVADRDCLLFFFQVIGHREEDVQIFRTTDDWTIVVCYTRSSRMYRARGSGTKFWSWVVFVSDSNLVNM